MSRLRQWLSPAVTSGLNLRLDVIVRHPQALFYPPPLPSPYPLPIFRNPSAMPQYGHNLPCMISPCKDQQFGREGPSLNTGGVMKPSQIIVEKPFGTLPSSYKSGIVKLT